MTTMSAQEKMGRYGSSADDFQADGELTVTITLSEYRFLVQEQQDKKEMSERISRLESERSRMKNDLTDQIAKLQRDKTIILECLRKAMHDRKEEADAELD